jgi:hypothetical protein
MSNFIYIAIMIAIVAIMFWRRVIRADRSAGNISSGQLSGPGAKGFLKVLKTTMGIIAQVTFVIICLAIIFFIGNGVYNTLFPVEKRHTFVPEGEEFGYTPNTTSWQKYTYSAPKEGYYRARCTEGYNQRNLPYSGELAVYVPCEGRYLPGVSKLKKFRHLNQAQQIIVGNGVNFTDGQKVVHLSKGEQIVLKFRPNIGSVARSGKVLPLTEAMKNNSGRVRFVMERMLPEEK